MNLKYIFKIVERNEWYKAKESGVYSGSLIDIKDGYMHFSEKEQILKTLKKHYPNQENLILLKVNTFNLEQLFWEQASNGDLYPHLYSDLNIREVENEFELSLDENGVHSIPNLI